jgi:hypothetical protein
VTAALLVTAGSGLAASCSAAGAVSTASSPVAAATPAIASVPGSSGTAPGPAGTLRDAGTATVPTASRAAAAKPHTSAAPGTQAAGKLANGTTWVAEYPKAWNGTLVLYSHGYGALTAADAPDSPTQAALLAQGYALAGSSFDPNGSEWALNTAVSDQWGALAAVESTVLPQSPKYVIALGTSMGGLVSALEAQQGAGKISGAVTTCGIVAGGVNLSQYQIDGEYAIAQLLGDPKTQLTGLDDDSANSTATALNNAAAQAQSTAAGQARLALAMAFLNIPDWDPDSDAPAPAGQAAAEEEAQYGALMQQDDNVLDFVEGGRESIEQADGGSAAWTAGTNFAQLLTASPYDAEVTALYQSAGLNLQTDLATLTSKATLKASPAALQTLETASVPSGQLAVPELDLHTVGDNIVPVQNENYYAALVAKAGSSAELREAYTDSFGHCNFSVSEQVAGIAAVVQRLASGQWGDAATAAGLEKTATALGLDPAHFITYSPTALTGAVAGG